MGGTGRCGSSTADRDEVAIFDATSGAVLGRRPTGDNPHEVAISSRVDKAYITNETAGTISVLSTRTLDSSTEIVLGPRPHHIEASRDGAEIVVGLVGTNAAAMIQGRAFRVRHLRSRGAGTGGVAVVDVDARVVIDTWAYPADGRVHGVAFSPATLN